MAGRRLRVSLKRTFLACIASLASVFFLSSSLSLLGGWLGNSSQSIAYGFGLGLFAVIYAFFVMILWGIPAHLMMVYFRVRSVFWYLASGVLGGPLLLIIIRPFGKDPVETLFWQVLVFSGVGLLAALIFWFVAVRKL